MSQTVYSSSTCKHSITVAQNAIFIANYLFSFFSAQTVNIICFVVFKTFVSWSPTKERRKKKDILIASKLQ